MKNLIFALALIAVVGFAASSAFAPLVTHVNSSDTSTVDLRDKDTSKPVKFLR